MKCAACDREFKDGDEVQLEAFGDIVDGKFRETEEPTIRHYDDMCWWKPKS